MLKTMKSGATYSFPLNRKNSFKCEGYAGSYNIIDAATCANTVYVLLEHNVFGDETACLLVSLPLNCLRWYVLDKGNKQIKSFFIPSQDILAETWDSVNETLCDYYPQVELDNIEFWTDEEIDNMEE